MAFGHRNVGLVGLFFSLENGNEMKERAKDMAFDLLRDDEAAADRDPLTKDLIRFLQKERRKGRWRERNYVPGRWDADKSQYER